MAARVTMAVLTSCALIHCSGLVPRQPVLGRLRSPAPPLPAPSMPPAPSAPSVPPAPSAPSAPPAHLRARPRGRVAAGPGRSEGAHVWRRPARPLDAVRSGQRGALACGSRRRRHAASVCKRLLERHPTSRPRRRLWPGTARCWPGGRLYPFVFTTFLAREQTSGGFHASMLPITQRSGSRVVEAPRRYAEAGAAPATRQYAGRGRLDEDGTDARLLSRRVRARACAELRAGQGDAREPPSQLVPHQSRLGPPASTAADT